MNKVILMGRLTKDPELRKTGNDTSVVTFGLAVNRRFLKPGEERQADFFNIVAWSKLADFCGKYFQKGRQVLVEGRLQNRTWDDKEGVKHYITEVVAEEAYFADGKRPDEGGGTYPLPDRPAKDAKEAPADGYFPMDEDEQLPF
jgi:single-strand DNA-binding protein